MPATEASKTVPLRRHLLWTGGLSAAYLLVSYGLIGFRPEQVVLVVLGNGLYYLSAATRRLVTGFSVFIGYWVLYDYMKAFPNYRYRPVSIAGLYELEKSLFGIPVNGVRLTPNEYWLTHAAAWLDALSGLFYLCWIPVPLAFAAFLWWRNGRQFACFALTFLLVNLLGFAVYYLFPAAPPWYVQAHGFGFNPLTAGSTAGLARFDQLLGTGVFASIYAKGSNVFAAMPSLHSAYPVVVLYFGLKNRLGWVNGLFAGVAAGIWFAAVYTSHHYVLDVLAGIGCAGTGIALFDWLRRRSRPVAALTESLARATGGRG
ncbi:MAG TPA: phosphatase PAP2 family protein [Cytophagales bacterium]